MAEHMKLIEGMKCPLSGCGSRRVGLYHGGKHCFCYDCTHLLWEVGPNGELIEWRREFLGPPPVVSKE